MSRVSRVNCLDRRQSTLRTFRKIDWKVSKNPGSFVTVFLEISRGVSRFGDAHVH